MRLIDADEIIKSVTVNPMECMECPEPEYAEDIINIVESMPTIDAVDVVRCRDCKFWDKYPSSTAAPDYHHCGFGINVNWHTRADEYCSRGERRDE